MLAQRIAETTGIRCHLVDDIAWLPNWTMVEDEVQRETFSKLCGEEEWILDSAYGKWVDIPLQRVELIVGLDYPRWLSLSRLLKRTLLRLVDGKPICNGNRETLKLTLSRESIIAWHFRSFARKRQRIRKWEAEGLPVLRFRSPKEVEAWLAGLEAVTD